ncbi:FAD-dependent oxidoreductase [Pyrobaculum aerophilum]|uniref:Glutamate synthase small subunit gltD n=2 Tax=Pyrobaculum aerophilum TaxID=13773 RepID=Q8ZTJ0_PYRAE|nr:MULTISPECIES: FAD-dependent oxidoreductase [Pyrobaculum]AAL64771.1 glutamate synthase small subunit gltD [Pyrobaculum aerophilum str. IM2]MCX8136281.1 FAD-dependent oxidoreductase [Pyrobaculum aerophilum]HII47618.1 FAD-dependent oxidoreductase [Pyrobaculum aerophilum]
MKFLLRCKPDTKKPPTGKKVAIIGAGPAGLGAAGILLCNGHEVHIYDALPEPGGLLMFGIPPFRIPRENVREGIRELVDAGAKFFTSTFVYCGEKPHEHEALLLAKDYVSLEELVGKYDAVIITTGTWKSRSLGVPGENLPGVYKALDYLFRIYAHQLGYLPKEKVYPTGRKVLVVGAGLTAVDAALEAREQGAEKIIVAYRRTINEAPAGRKTIETELIAKGIEFRELINPVAFLGRDRVERVRFVKMRLGPPDKSGRPAPEPIPGSEFEEEFVTVLIAAGEIATPPGKCLGMELNPDGTIKVNEKMMTTRRGVFAAGDVVTGPSLIGKALGSGMRAAQFVDEFLR